MNEDVVHTQEGTGSMHSIYVMLWNANGVTHRADSDCGTGSQSPSGAQNTDQNTDLVLFHIGVLVVDEGQCHNRWENC